MMTRLAWCAAAFLACHAASAEEICRYSGATSYAGRVAVETKATTANGETTVDATARVAARSFGLIDWQYLYQEIGTSRDGELERIGVNTRYSVLGSIRRQQWDVFSRSPAGMTAWRAEANSLADFQAKHPRFVQHWEPASFGEPWLPDFSTAEPERRADLDLPSTAMPAGLGTPLALGFYWVRWAGQGQHIVPVFLAGFKHDTRVDVRVVSLDSDANGLLHLRSSVRHPQLSETEISTGDAWVTADHHLVRVTFDARGDHGSARGELHLDGCQGAAPAP
jgi:hypothetical protein